MRPNMVMVLLSGIKILMPCSLSLFCVDSGVRYRAWLYTLKNHVLRELPIIKTKSKPIALVSLQKSIFLMVNSMLLSQMV